MAAVFGAGIHDDVRWEVHRVRIEKDRDRTGHYSCALIVAAAVALNRCDRTIRRWLEEQPSRRARFELTDLEMGYIRWLDGNVHAAWEALVERGLISVGYKTILRAFKRLATGIRDGLRGGVEKMRNGLPHLTLPPATRPNEIFEIDHTFLAKILVWDPLTGRQGHPWLTVVIDVFTRLIVGFSITLAYKGAANTESAFAAIADTLIGRDYDGTFVGGMPEWFRFDQGSDFMNGVAEATERLGGKNQPTEANSPWLKPFVERLNGTIKRTILPRLPGYGLRLETTP
jgi:Integrase core domain.